MTGDGTSRSPLGPRRWPGHAATVAVLIVLLSALTALASFQGAEAGADQRAAEVAARDALAAANAAYSSAGEEIIRDYARYDSWYLHGTEGEGVTGYPADFSPALVAALGRSAEDPFDALYHDEMYAGADAGFAEANRLFDRAQQYNERANRLQLVVMTGAIGLALTAWASLLRAQNRLRPAIAVLAMAALAAGAVLYFTAPAAPA